MTAVEYLVKELSTTLGPIEVDVISQILASDAIKKAKEIFEQQIIDAWEDGQNSFSTRNAKKYYNETFKNK